MAWTEITAVLKLPLTLLLQVGPCFLTPSLMSLTGQSCVAHGQDLFVMIISLSLLYLYRQLNFFFL